MTTEIVREGEVAYAKPLPRALLRDARLSWAARALFGFLWDLPSGWRPTAAHLATMGPDGRDAIRGRLRELAEVGALRLERIFRDDGKLAGTRWVLRAAHLWAVESPLRSSDAPAESRTSRESGFPTLGEANAKVHQLEGSPTEGSPTTTSDVWHDALELEIEAAAPVRNPAGLRRAIVARYRANGGPDPEILARVRERQNAANACRDHARTEAERLAALQRQADATPLPYRLVRAPKGGAS